MIKLTEVAATEVKKVISEQKMSDKTMLRVGVKSGGCSGFEYSLTFTEETDEKMDEIYEQHGVKVVIDKKSDLYVGGSTVDYCTGVNNTGLEQRGFVFNNPSATNTCGCGNSFGV